MKLSKSIKFGALAGLLVTASILVVAKVSAITPGSIPYQGAETSGVNFPAFNIFNGVPSVGNEADFIRVKKDGEANSTLRNSVDTTCKTGDRFDVWFYLHNGAKPSLNNNGSGPGVAHNVVAKVALPSGESTSFNINGGVTASNAQAISDGATINCGGKKFKIKYVEGSANAFLDLPNKNVSLPRSIVEGGAAIGTNLLDGNVWGCWDQRVWMGLKVEVEEITTPPPVSKGVCKAVDLKLGENRKVEVTVNGEVNNAEIIGYKIDFGDGTVVNQKTASHTYAKDGTYTITGYVQVKYADGKTEWKTAESCMKTVQFKPGEPPVVPPTTPPTTTPPVTPTTLPDTGAGSVAAIFLAVSTASGVGYYVFSRKFYA